MQKNSDIYLIGPLATGLVNVFKNYDLIRTRQLIKVVYFKYCVCHITLNIFCDRYGLAKKIYPLI